MNSEIESIAPIGTISSIGPLAPIRPLKPSKNAKVIDVGIYSVDKYKHCRQPPLNHCNAVAGGFAGAMKARGHNWPFVKRDVNFTPDQWDTATDQAPGGADTVDFVYVASHGRTSGKELPFNHSLGRTQWLYWFYMTCDSARRCWISTIILSDWWPAKPKHPQTAMRLGGGRLRWLVLDCCRSQQMRDVNETKLEEMSQLAETTPGRTWGRCYDGVHMLFGFTGLSSDAEWTSDRGKSFGLRAGRGETLAESWIDEAFCWIIKGTDAPAVTAFGQSVAEVDQRLRSESLKQPGSSPTRPIRNFVYSTMWRS